MNEERDLDRLKQALAQAAPTPDPARRAGAVARAMAEYDRVQGTQAAARRNSVRPERAGSWTGVRAMLSHLTSRAGLAGGASLAVIALGLVLLGPQMSPPRGPAPAPLPTELPTAASDAPAGAMRDATAATAPEAVTAPQAGPSLRTRDAAPEAAALAEGDNGANDLMAVEPAPPPAPALDSAGGAATTRLLAAPPQPGFGDRAAPALRDTESFPQVGANPLKITAETPVSTFSIDVDTASYAIVRSSLAMGSLPPPGAVRIEEMVNYFPYDWPAPAADEPPFRATVSAMQTPWNPGTRLVTIALQGRLPAVQDRPPLNLVFLIDTSGSMDQPNRLPLLRQSLRLLLDELRPEDQVAIVTYAGAAGLVLDATPAGERAAILAALDRLGAGGATAGQEGLALAYATARAMTGQGEVSRVLLATDGDFNVGISDPEGLAGYIARERQGGTYLSVLGFGRGNLDDRVMQALAQAGNGTAAYIDTLSEARKVLVDQLAGTLFPIADDVKVQVEWNPAEVAEYRLIGYETRTLAREDFANDRVDAGEIGAGHSVTALYEITPPGSTARLTEPLRYGASEAQGAAGELGFLRLRWKEPGETLSREVATPIPVDLPQSGNDARFAAAIAGFGQLLTGSPFLGDWTWDQAIALASDARGDDPFGYRAEAVNLMRLAQSLSR
jgi:Ca-activated chloride channel homolog